MAVDLVELRGLDHCRPKRNADRYINSYNLGETKRHRLYKSYCRLKLSIEIFSRSWAQKPDIKAIGKDKEGIYIIAP